MKREQQVHQTRSKYRSDLENERVEANSELEKLQHDMAKQTHHSQLLELKAPQAGIVKDLATHTIGTVVSTGTVLLSIVPESEPLVAEVLIHNDDVGFVHPHQQVKIKLAAYPFQKYGLLDGDILQIWPDSTDGNQSNGQNVRTNDASTPTETVTGFKALVRLNHQSLSTSTETLNLVAGMQVIAEIREGKRTVLQYLLLPDSGRATRRRPRAMIVGRSRGRRANDLCPQFSACADADFRLGQRICTSYICLH